MATYAKYAPRNKQNYVDWEAIGNQLSSTLTQEAADREKRRAEIDAQSREYTRELANTPLTEHAGIRERMLDLATEGQSSLLMLERLFKSGQLSTKDYLAKRQNLMEGANQAIGLAKKFGDNYADRMERMKTELSSFYEQDNFQEAEGFMNFSQSKFFIDPETFKLTIAKVDNNGNRVSDYMPVNSLEKAMDVTLDKYNVWDNTQEAVKKLAPVFETLGGTLDDVRKNPAYNGAKSKFIDSMLENDFNTMSILVDYLDGYTFTKDVNNTDPDKVLLAFDPSSGNYIPKPTAKQKQEAYNAVDEIFESMVKRQQKYIQPTYTQPTTEQLRQRAGAKQQADMVSNLAKLYQGNDAEVNAAIDFIRGAIVQGKSNLTFIDRKPDGTLEYRFMDKNGNEQVKTVNLSDYDNVQNFLEGNAALLLGITNVNDALANSSVDRNRGMGSGSGSYTAPAEPKTAFESTGDWLMATLPAKFSTSASESANQLRSAVTKLGGTIDFSRLNPNVDVIIKAQNGTKGEFETDPKDNPDVKEQIINFLLANTSGDLMQGLMDTNQFNTSDAEPEPSGKTVTRQTLQGLVGKPGYEGYTLEELIDYYTSQGYTVE